MMRWAWVLPPLVMSLSLIVVYALHALYNPVEAHSFEFQLQGVVLVVGVLTVANCHDPYLDECDAEPTVV